MVSARHRRRTALVPLATLLAIALSVQATTDSRRFTFTIPTAPIALGLDALPIVTPEGAGRRRLGIARGARSPAPPADAGRARRASRLHPRPPRADQSGRPRRPARFHRAEPARRHGHDLRRVVRARRPAHRSLRVRADPGVLPGLRARARSRAELPRGLRRDPRGPRASALAGGLPLLTRPRYLSAREDVG